MRFSTRLIIAVLSVLFILLGLLVWNSVRLISSSHAELFQTQINQQTSILANSLAAGLAFNDRATLNDVLLLLKNNQDVEYVQVLNRYGEPMAGFGNSDSEHIEDLNYSDATRDGIYDMQAEINLAGQSLGSVRIGYSIDGILKITRATRNQNTLIAVFALFISVSLIVLFAYFLSTGLRKLEEGARALHSGNFSHRIQISTGDDIEDIANAINSLAQHLETTRLALQREHEALVKESSRLSTLVDGINAVVWEAKINDGFRFTFFSDNVEDLLGYAEGKLLTPDYFSERIPHADREWVMRRFNDTDSKDENFSFDHRVTTDNDEIIWVRHIGVVEQVGDVCKLKGMMFDITESKKFEEKIIYLAEHDALTGLINRRKFQEELLRHVNYAQRYKHPGTLLFLDLDQFKYINDSYGHHAGDEFLIQVAHRIRQALRETDIVGRLGGDEFGVVLPESSEKEAIAAADYLLQELAATEFSVSGSPVLHVSASIGITTFPDQGLAPGELLASADAAMYMAKEAGRNSYHVYSEADHGLKIMQAKMQWEDRIRRALEEDRFALYCQPVCKLGSGEVIHYEVLLRMMNDGEVIKPNAFLDTAERFGLIREIDRWVVENTIRIQSESMSTSSPLKLAINLSGRYFGQPDVLEFVQYCLEKYKADPYKIVFEVTETAAVENLPYAGRFIDSLKKIGCQFALDDFGVGFSSLHYLKNLDVDIVKIDGSFVRTVASDPSDKIFVSAITELARGLGILTVAEFVESGEIETMLRELSVDYGQGYFLGKPVPINDVVQQ